MAPFSYGGQLYLLFLSIVISFANGSEDSTICPIGCFCDSKAVDGLPGGQGLKVNCHPTLSATGTFDIKLPANTIQLDLAKYGLREITQNTFAGLVHLQKLDLQGNKINTIEGGAFRTLPKLEVLDLSRNNLKRVAKDTFAGLASLQRLKLTDNNIELLEASSFDTLHSLSKLEISENPLKCDCNLKWLVKWTSVQPNILANVARTRCSTPSPLADIPIKKLVDSDLQCGIEAYGERQESPKLFSSGSLHLSPSHAQAVFEGDELTFHCQQESSSGSLNWLVNDNPLSIKSDVIRITQAAGHSVLTISRLEKAFKGKVTCVSSEGSKASVDVLVLAKDTPVCNPIVLETSRGQYRWSAALAGTTLKQWCQRKPNFHEAAEATLQCRYTGEWSATVNVSQCAYTSEVTDTLHKFATMNTSFTMSTLLESAKQLLNYTNDPRLFQNPMDVVYFSQAVENYLPYLTQSFEVGHYMMDMMAKFLGISPKLLSEAQKHGLACRRLLNVMDNITTVAVPAFRHHSETLAIETYFLKPMARFEGMTCSWYNTRDEQYPRQPQRKVFHCVQNNKTLLSLDKQLLVSVVVPQSVYAQIDHQLSSYGSSVRLMFAAFLNSSLFPTTSESSLHESVTSLVIGSQLLGSKRYFNLTEQVNVAIMRDPSKVDHEPQPVWWDQYANGGYGSWNSDHCQISSKSKDLVRFSCSRLGYYGLRYLRAPDDPLLMVASKWHSPVIYAGGAIATLLVLASLTAFVSRAGVIRMAQELKHSLPNVWLTSVLALYLYIMGVYQTHEEVACRLIGITLHHLIISSFMWILVGVHAIFRKVSTNRCNESDFFSDGKHQKALHRPLTRYYLVAYGVPAIIVAVTAATSLEHYETSSYCFVIQGPAFIGALVVPCVLIFTIMIGFSLSTVCVLAPSRAVAKERSGLLDAESGPKCVLASHMVQFLLIAGAQVAAGYQMAGHSAVMSLVLSVLVAVLAVGFGVYIFITFCIFRHDVFKGRCSKSQKLEEQEEMTSNMVELCPPRPLPAAAIATNSIDRRHLPLPPPSSVYTKNNFKTSSPANSHIPQVQDLTVSPLVMADPYSVVPVKYNSTKRVEASLASVDYTDSSTMRMGAPCDMATFDLGPASSTSLIGVGTPKRLLGASASLPRPTDLRHHRGKSRKQADETESKVSSWSVGSSRSGHSGKKRHKKPTRKRSRQQLLEPKEPVYNNVNGGEEEDYLGDDDQFDTIERQRRKKLPAELPSVILEAEGEDDNNGDDEDDLLSQGREEPASLEDLPDSSQLAALGDLSKRETSV